MYQGEELTMTPEAAAQIVAMIEKWRSRTNLLGFKLPPPEGWTLGPVEPEVDTLAPMPSDPKDWGYAMPLPPVTELPPGLMLGLTEADTPHVIEPKE